MMTEREYAAYIDGYQQAIEDAVKRVQALSHEPCAECCEVDIIAAIKGGDDE